MINSSSLLLSCRNSVTGPLPFLVAFLFVLVNGVLVLGVVPVGVAVEAVAS